ncbi:hypothetical protein [Nitrospira moscoviensis]|uniref:DUF883 domain-containing protein n=1 Tax=Nitrospira moscoviensis TaxID=42253 RepID=A0A0K2GDZ1_NITMO|nr:hypothetical protein [Nitrospira moscoviensis]ALA59171.1 hypothetical protein NITMOv2_2761 [Nitrospira moscoviensis]
MEKQPERRDEVRTSVHEAIDQDLDQVEAKIDSTIDRAKGSVHDIRTQLEEAADRTLERLMESWGETRRRLEAKMADHPWMVLGILLLAGYFLSEERRRSVPRESDGGRKESSPSTLRAA